MDDLIRLEIGSGFAPTPGFTHLDVNPNAPGVDIVGPAFPLDLPDESVSELRCVDVLEHLSYRDTERALAEWFRVLTPGGRMYVQVPDAGLIMEWYSHLPERLVERIPPDLPQTAMMGAVWRLFGGQLDGVQAHGDDEADFNLHRTGFDRESLCWYLLRAGFDVVSVETNPHPNLCVVAVKP